MWAKISWREKLEPWGETGGVIIGPLAELYLADKIATNMFREYFNKMK